MRDGACGQANGPRTQDSVAGRLGPRESLAGLAEACADGVSTFLAARPEVVRRVRCGTLGETNLRAEEPSHG